MAVDPAWQVGALHKKGLRAFTGNRFWAAFTTDYGVDESIVKAVRENVEDAGETEDAGIEAAPKRQRTGPTSPSQSSSSSVVEVVDEVDDDPPISAFGSRKARPS